jgi:hypothetical protein
MPLLLEVEKRLATWSIDAAGRGGYLDERLDSQQSKQLTRGPERPARHSPSTSA